MSGQAVTRVPESEFKWWDDEEPLLRDDVKRLLLFPIEHTDIWDAYKEAEASFWTAEEVDMEQDVRQWNANLTDAERHFLLTVLAFFAGADGIVAENLAKRFLKMVKYPEARAYYGFQLMIEGIHAEMYHLIIDTLPSPPDVKLATMRGIKTSSAVNRKAEWALRWIEDKGVSFHERLVAFACVEGIHFSSSFCAIFWFKKRNLMPGLVFSNQLISRDEGSHTNFAVLLYSHHLQHRLPEERVHEIVKSATEAERAFVREALSVDLMGMNSGMMEQYVEFTADRLLKQLGYQPVFGASNPFPWMDTISMPNHVSFFERRNADYQNASIASGKNRPRVESPSTDSNGGLVADEDF